jgi:serine-type D-Ala-D-Ala carboxypeptidase
VNDKSRTPPPISSQQFAPVYKVLSDAIAAHAFPGCAFGVYANGRTALEDALGHFTYEQQASPPVTPQTSFDIASLTKVVATTAAAMLLCQRNRLELDLPVGEVLPGFVIGRPRGHFAHQVTIRHLLAHNSGLSGYVEFFRQTNTPAGLLRACLELPLHAAPGDRVEYSDPGFILLGKALEVIAGDHLATWAAREIFGPLQLSDTRFCPPLEMRQLIPPTEEDKTFRHRRIQGEVQDENASLLHGAAGHAGLFSNVPNLLRFGAEILRTFRPEQETSIFKRDTIELFATRQVPSGSSRALGWDTPSAPSSAGRYFSPRSIGHLGYSGCSLWIDLDAAIAVVLLTNRTWPDRQSQLIREVRPAFHNAVREAL